MSSTGNIFEFATRNKLRFASSRGELSVENLWEVPLRAKDDFNLNSIAQTVNRGLKASAEESFVETTRSPEQDRREISLEIVKYIIEVKKTEEEALCKRLNAKREKEKLLTILAEKQDGALSALSVDELQKRIAQLSE